MKKTKEILNLSERQKEVAYCILFLAVLLFLLFGDKIALHFIKEDPNKNNSVFGENEDLNYKIDFLQELTMQELTEKINQHETFLLLSSRYRCETCDLYLPTLKEVKSKIDTPFYYINRDTLDTSSKSYTDWLNSNPKLKEHLAYTPYLMYYKEGELKKEVVGKISQKELEEQIIQELGK